MKSDQFNKLEDIKVGQIAPTKFGIDLMAESIAEQVNNGDLSALDVAIKMNAVEQLVKIVKEKIMASVMDDLTKHPKMKAEVNGATVSVMDSVKYDYSHLDGWQELDNQIAELKEKQKAIEDHEKTYFKGNLPIKSATSTFKVQLSK